MFIALITPLILSTIPAASGVLDDLVFELRQKRAKEECRWNFDPLCEARYLGLITEESPADIERQRVENAARQERDRKWKAYCKPRVVSDPLGVERYVYAHKHCDEGATGPADQ